MKKLLTLIILLCLIFTPLAAFAKEHSLPTSSQQPSAVKPVSPSTPASEAIASKIDKGDTAWVLISTALVMLMTPGLALFYGGIVKKKNTP